MRTTREVNNLKIHFGFYTTPLTNKTRIAAEIEAPHGIFDADIVLTSYSPPSTNIKSDREIGVWVLSDGKISINEGYYWPLESPNDQ